ncbi:MAG: hypothetical protein ACXWLP_12120 [Myxococcaceae bacterium]
MRRLLVASVVLFIAACGGGVRSDAKPEAAQRNAIPTDRESALLIESLSKTFGSDAVDSCLAAWQDARDVHADGAGPASKPGAGFRVFLSQCVGAPVPADLRNTDPSAVRSQNTRASSDMRMDRAGSTADVRIEREPALRGTFAQ